MMCGIIILIKDFFHKILKNCLEKNKFKIENQDGGPFLYDPEDKFSAIKIF